MKLGVAHVAGLYPISTSFVTDGADAIKALGPRSRTIKLWLSSDFTSRYPNQTGWGTVNNAVDLAASTPMATVIADTQFTDIFLNTFPWWAGFESESLTNYWINGVTTGGVTPATYLAEERTRTQALAAHLLSTYAGTGKTFYIQNWEGDWQLLNSFTPTDVVRPYVADRMRAVMQARFDGVKAARAASSATGVAVRYGIEVNRALDPGRRLHRELLPLLQPDYVSWSAYEGIVIGIYGSTLQNALSLIDVNMRRFHAEIRKYCSSDILIGEYGWPENEIDTATFDIGSMIDQTIETGTELGWTHALYWQIYDNEAGPRGFYIRKPDGSLSLAGLKHQQLFL